MRRCWGLDAGVCESEDNIMKGLRGTCDGLSIIRDEKEIPVNAQNSVTDERAVLYRPSGASSSASGARIVSGTLASARHEPCGGTQCVVAIGECHQVAETDRVA